MGKSDEKETWTFVSKYFWCLKHRYRDIAGIGFYRIKHCVKSVHIWSFSSPYFSVFGPYSVRMPENTSSNINEVIRGVLNILIFFYKKISHALKALKALKILNSAKSAKRHKDTRVKAQNANKPISDYFPLRCFLGAFFIFISL